MERASSGTEPQESFTPVVRRCPNLPHRSLNEGDGGAGAAEMAGSDGVGCLFAAVRGKGSFWGPLLDNGLPSTRCRVADVEETAGAVFMQSYESRHSSHRCV